MILLKNWGNHHFHFLICLCTTFQNRSEILFLKKSGKYYFHFLLCLCTTKLTFLKKWENYHFHFPIENTSCFLGMRWYLLTFAFFQDRSLLLSYFSTSLPWLSKSTWISYVCQQFQEKKNWHYLFCKFDATLLPRIVPWRTPKTDATAEKIKEFSKIVMKINNMQGSV